MGWFSNLFNKMDQQLNRSVIQNSGSTEDQNPLNKETNKLIGQLFSELAGRIDSFEHQTQINQILLMKRQRTCNSNDYIDVLINNVTFFVEMEGMAKHFRKSLRCQTDS